MPSAEMMRVGLFVLAVGAVYAFAGLLVLDELLRRASRGPLPSRRRVLFRRAVFITAGVGLLCFAYGFFVEPYWLEVRRVTIQTPKLAPGARPIRIVHISDLHCDAHPRLEERLPGVIAAERPDLIVFTGDALNSPQGLPIFKRCMRALSAVAPLFVVKGNWDTVAWSRIDLFGDTGARELDGTCERLEVNGSPVQVCGVAVGNEGGIGPLLGSSRREELTVFLHHYPDEIHDVSKGGADLYCAGHTHGGQVALPFYGALVTLSRFGKRFEAGLYRVDGTWLNVNRGIGMEGGRAPRVRFCARPEVTVLDIIPEPR